MAIKRFFAQILDVIIYGALSYIPLVVLSIFVGIISILSKDIGNTLFPLTMFLSIILTPVAFGYFTYIHLKNKSATLGYRIMRLKLVEQNRSNLSSKHALTRAVVKPIYLFMLLFFIFDIIHGVVLFQNNGETDPLDSILQTKCVKA